MAQSNASVAPSKSEDTSLGLPQPIIGKLDALRKGVEREDAPNQLEREKIENAHF